MLPNIDEYQYMLYAAHRLSDTIHSLAASLGERVMRKRQMKTPRLWEANRGRTLRFHFLLTIKPHADRSRMTVAL